MFSLPRWIRPQFVLVGGADEEKLIVLANRQTIVHYNLHPLAILPEAKVKQPRIVIGLELSIVQRDDTLEQLLMGGERGTGRYEPAVTDDALAHVEP